jgi:hypothetical protein
MVTSQLTQIHPGWLPTWPSEAAAIAGTAWYGQTLVDTDLDEEYAIFFWGYM